MPRVPYVDADDLPDEYEGLLTSVRTRDELDPEYRDLMQRDERNVYRSLAHAPETLRAFRALGGAVREEFDFAPREREIVILTVASELRSAYEWHQHARIGLDAGLSPGEFRALSNGRYDEFDGAERALAEYTSAFVRGTVDDALHEALAERFDDATVVGVGFLAGVYVVIARLMAALDVPTEEAFVGWELENLDLDG